MPRSRGTGGPREKILRRPGLCILDALVFSLLSRAYGPAKGGGGRNSGPPSGPQPHLSRCISSFSPLPTPASTPPVQGVTVAQRSSSPTPGAAPSEGKGHLYLRVSERIRGPPTPLGLQHFVILSRACQAGRKPSGRLLCTAVA